MKSNNIPCITKELYAGGAGFDCASSEEMRIVSSIGVGGDDIVFANPCKSIDALLYAKQMGIHYTTFDNYDEYCKIMKINPLSKPILRIFIDDKGGSRIPLNKKFGLHIDQIQTIMTSKIYGIAFHVGSDCTSVDSYRSAFKTVRNFLRVFKNHSKYFIPEILDIGGGFSGLSSKDSFFSNELAPVIRKELHSLSFQKVIAEPGRYFAEESCTLQVPIIGRKVFPNGEKCITIDESVYGMFSGVLFDGFQPTFRCVTQSHGPQDRFTIFGRTCDSADKIAEGVLLPQTISDSDILEVKNIGAYSWVSSSEFNGFSRPKIVLN